MLKRSDPKFTPETIVGRMRAGARRARSVAEAAAQTPESQPPLPILPGSNQFARGKISPIVLQPPFQPRSDDHYHVNDLLKYHDRAFVQNAYRAILKRGPDATGYKSFIDALRSGRLNKIDVLARLRYSTEGRAKQVHVDGLFVPSGIRLLYGLPMVGYILNLLVALARLPRSIRNEQQFQAHVLAQHEMIAEHANHLGEAVSSLNEEITRTFSSSLQGLSELHRQQIDALTNEEAKHFEVFAGEQQADRDELMRRWSEMNERFEAAIQAHKVEAFSQLSQLSKGLEEALAGEMAMREQSFGGLSIALQDEQTRRARALENLNQKFRAEQAARANGLSELARAVTDEQAARKGSLEQLTSGLESEQRAREDAFRTLSEHLGDEASRLHGEAAMMEKRVAAVVDARHTSAEFLGKELRAEMQKLFQAQQETRTELVLQSERVARLLDEAGRRLAESPTEPELRSLAAEAKHTLDAVYLSLEDQFRGTRAEVKQRLQAYLPLVKQAQVGGKQTPILDVGCGRGEWLELLSEEGLNASGIDSNRMMILRCRQRKLDVVQADLMDHLQGLPDAALGAVTGFHIVEHLPIETLVSFLNETVRVVKPGGLIILETPNPQNVLVGTCNFYFDPTHRNPLPSPVMKFLLDSRGFTGVEVLSLNPSDETPVTGESDLVRRFNQYFYGPMDYAVIGRRP